MWNRYGKDDGYCLCFNGTTLDQHFKNELGNIYVGQYEVVYDEAEQKELVSNTLQSLLREHKKKAFRVGETARHVEDMILSLLFSLKHPCYREETEIRYIFAIPNQLGGNSKVFAERTNFRPKNGIICPYIEIRIEPEVLIEKVFLSPINHSETCREGLDMFLGKHLVGRAVLPSQVPFRIT
jgi:hypothetical protein